MSETIVLGNKIQLVGRTIIIRLIGKQTRETVLPLKLTIEQMFHQHQHLKNILIDLSDVEKADTDAQREAKHFLSELPDSKVAMFGAQGFMGKIRQRLIKMTTKTNARVRVFKGELFAREWLAQRD